ncbi:MAG: ATP-binding cassette domain-containing protein [Myxococcota bacterium]
MSLPPIYSGRRRTWLRRLVMNGVAQGAVAFGLAHLLRSSLGGVGLSPETAHTVPWLEVVGIAGAGSMLLGLRAIEAADAERLGQDYVMRVRLRIFEAVTRGQTRSGRRGRWGVTMTRLISDLNSLRNWVSAGIARSVVASITIGGLTVALLAIHPAAALAAATMIGLTTAAATALVPTLRTYVREARRRRGRLANNLGEKVLAAGTVRQFDATREEARRVRTHSVWLRDALVRRTRLSRVLRSIPGATLPVAVGVLVLLASRTSLSPADLTVCVLLLGLMGTSLSDLSRAVDHRLSFEEGRRRIAEVLDSPRIKESRKAVDLPSGGPVEVDIGRVSVRGRLTAGPFHARPGRTVQLTGGPGTGKSTLLALVARWIDPDRGRIELDGVPVRRVSLASLSRTVQLVTPDVPLLRGRIVDNLGYGSEEVDPAWIAKVAATCGLDDEEPLLRDGLETRVEEQGHNLPDGLRARIALARAAVVSPRLLAIDHPTLLLDPAARTAMRAVIELLGCTALVAATPGIDLAADAEWVLPDPIEPAPGRATPRAGS